MTERRVLKHLVPVDGAPHTIGAGWSAPLLVAVQGHRSDVVTVWYEHIGPDDRAVEQRVFATGEPIPAEGWVSVGSCMTADGGLVWHLYERPLP